MDQEHSTGLADGSTLDTLVLYQVRDGQIVDCWLGYDSPGGLGESTQGHTRGRGPGCAGAAAPGPCPHCAPTHRRLARKRNGLLE